MSSQIVSLLPRLLPVALILLGSNSGIAFADGNANTLSGTLRTWPPDPSQYSLTVDDTYYSVAPALSGNEPAPAPMATPVGNTGTYTVNRGETVYAVMRATGVPVKDIISLNALQAPYHLRAGQVLQLSGAGSAPAPSVTAESYVQNDGTTHIVRAGETIYEVMRQTGVPVSKIISLNNLGTPYVIRVGQALRLH